MFFFSTERGAVGGVVPRPSATVRRHVEQLMDGLVIWRWGSGVGSRSGVDGGSMGKSGGRERGEVREESKVGEESEVSGRSEVSKVQ